MSTARREMSIGFSFANSFTSWGELKGASTLIVLGTAGTHHASGGSATEAPWTTTPVHVERLLKGDSGGTKTVLIRQLGGVGPDGSLWSSTDFPLLTPGQRYLLFLTPSLLQDQYYPVGAPQGVFSVTLDGRVNSYSAVVARVGVSVQDAAVEPLIQEVRMAAEVTTAP